MSDKSELKTLNLALQGGGSHGAFTWGVLDALLESGKIQFSRISGTSAGAMNAVVLATGFADAVITNEMNDRQKHQARCECARAKLDEFWGEIGRLGDAMLMGPWTVPLQKMVVVKQMMSPYQINQLTHSNVNVLLDTLKKVVGDFEKLYVKAEDLENSEQGCVVTAVPQLILCATDVLSGECQEFKNYPSDSNNGKPDLILESVMASACLPTLFEAVQINGRYYWDGGYSSNPALFPLVRGGCEDILLVQINPIELYQAPTSLHAIEERMSQLTFNAKLVTELDLIHTLPHFLALYEKNQLLTTLINNDSSIKEMLLKKVDEHTLNDLLENHKEIDIEEYVDMKMHRIDGGAILKEFDPATKLQTDTKFLKNLKALGYNAATKWLAQNFDNIGYKATLDIDMASKGALASLQKIKVTSYVKSESAGASHKVESEGVIAAKKIGSKQMNAS